MVGYDEDAESKVYRLYNPVNKTIIRSRDMIIDESPTAKTSRSSESLRATIGGEQEPVIEQEKISENSSENYLPLERITLTPTTTSTLTPTPIPTSTLSNIPDTIVFRPPSVNVESTPRGDSGPQDPGVRRTE